MRFAPLLCAVLCVVAACGCVTAGAAGNPPGTFKGCPRAVLPLPFPVDMYAPAARKAVLRFVHTRGLHLGTAGARTTDVLLVRHWLPSGWIIDECGLSVWQRSLAVGVYFPAMDPPHNPVGHCNSCASLVFLVSKQATGWTVWGNY